MLQMTMAMLQALRIVAEVDAISAMRVRRWRVEGKVKGAGLLYINFRGEGPLLLGRLQKN